MSFRAIVIAAIVSGSVYAQTSDVTSPSLVTFTVGPTSIDTRSGPQNISFSMQVSDDLSGVSNVRINLLGTSGQWQWAFPPRTAGNDLLGTYSTVFSFPQFTSSGVWTIQSLELIDRAGNQAIISTATLQARGLVSAINVVSTPDVTPPQIQSLQFTPAAVNLSAADASVTVRMRLSDTQTGVGIEPTPTGCNCTFQLLTLVSPSGRQSRRVGNTAFQLVSGTRSDGVWEASFPMPRYSEPGLWTVSELNLYDAVHNGLFTTGASLTGPGFASGLNVSASPADTTAPLLTGLSLSSAIVDTSLAAQTVTITFRVQDARSGADFVRDDPCPCRFIGARLNSPSGNQQVYTLFNPHTQVSGTALNGAWTSTVAFPRFAEAGTWNLTVYLKDRTQNQRELGAADLRAAGLTSSLNVIRASYVPDGTVSSTGGTIVDETFGSQAQIIVPPGALPSSTTIAIDVLENVPPIDVPQGFSAPATRFVNFELVPHPLAPIGPPGFTVTIPLVNPLPSGTELTLFRLDPISGQLVAARSVSAGYVLGRVSASGQSATFTGIASFSTVVGLPRSVQKPGDLNGDTFVNCADVAIVRVAFGKRTGQSGFDARADVNRDGVVNISDLSFVLRQLPSGMACQ